MSGTTLSVLFVVLAIVFVLLAILALFMLGSLRLHSILGLVRDGPRMAEPIPPLATSDVDHTPITIPTYGRWQLLVFAHHGLRTFPELVRALNNLDAMEDGVDVLWLAMTGERAVFEEAIRNVGLTMSPILVSREVYRQYNVRAMPFVVIVDPEGVVRGRGVVNYEATLLATWERAYRTPRRLKNLSPAVA